MYIMHKYEDDYWEYNTDIEGYVGLQRMTFTDDQEKAGVPDMIKDLDDIDMGLTDKTKIKLLHALRKTNCGHCDAPWMNPETFDEIVHIVSMYNWERNQ